MSSLKYHCCTFQMNLLFVSLGIKYPLRFLLLHNEVEESKTFLQDSNNDNTSNNNIIATLGVNSAYL